MYCIKLYTSLVLVEYSVSTTTNARPSKHIILPAWKSHGTLMKFHSHSQVLERS